MTNKQQMLLNMGKSRGCEVIICSEAYTSKTCGNCGFLHSKLGGNREYECPMSLFVHSLLLKI